MIDHVSIAYSIYAVFLIGGASLFLWTRRARKRHSKKHASTVIDLDPISIDDHEKGARKSGGNMTNIYLTIKLTIPYANKSGHYVTHRSELVVTNTQSFSGSITTHSPINLADAELSLIIGKDTRDPEISTRFSQVGNELEAGPVEVTTPRFLSLKFGARIWNDAQTWEAYVDVNSWGVLGFSEAIEKARGNERLALLMKIQTLLEYGEELIPDYERRLMEEAFHAEFGAEITFAKQKAGVTA